MVTASSKNIARENTSLNIVQKETTARTKEDAIRDKKSVQTTWHLMFQNEL